MTAMNSRTTWPTPSIPCGTCLGQSSRSNVGAEVRALKADPSHRIVTGVDGGFEVSSCCGYTEDPSTTCVVVRALSPRPGMEHHHPGHGTRFSQPFNAFAGLEVAWISL